MSTYRIALANIRFPTTPEESVALAEEAIAEASRKHVQLICFPECFVPGYRAPGKIIPPPNPPLLEWAWARIAEAAGRTSVGVILGTERVIDGALFATAL